MIETWKGIALACGRGERWCRYMADRKADPLPVLKLGGRVRIPEADLAAWIERQTRPVRIDVAKALAVTP